MNPERRRTAESECPVCYAIHDEEIHEATMRLRGWFRLQVTHRLKEEEMFGAADDQALAVRVA